MEIRDLFERYQYIPWTFKPNKLKMPSNEFMLDRYEEFNEIYQLIRANESWIHHVKATSSGAMPYNTKVDGVQRYILVAKKTSVELVVMMLEGCFRFTMILGRKADDNIITGTKALKTLMQHADAYGVRKVFQNNVVDKYDGLEIKKNIESPIIKVYRDSYKGKEFNNVHHIDLNSSYASRIVEAYPELRPMYKYLYDNRKTVDNGLFKHVLTNSIGAMQSEYCLNITYDKIGVYKAPYSLARFAQIAINGTNRWIADLCMRLEMSGRHPLLINTDGIWYQGELYEDANCGTDICQYKNDHKNCKLYIKTQGAYQYIEDGHVHSVVRGSSRLDQLKPDRSTWTWREIDNIKNLFLYKFDEEKGIVKYEEE